MLRKLLFVGAITCFAIPWSASATFELQQQLKSAAEKKAAGDTKTPRERVAEFERLNKEFRATGDMNVTKEMAEIERFLEEDRG